MADSAAFRFHEQDTKMFQPEVFDQLTAAGQTTPAYEDGWRWGNHMFQIDTTLNGSTSVELIIQGSLDGTKWFNLDAGGSTIIILASGPEGFYFSEVAAIQLRVKFEAEVGGTDATVDISYLGGN